MGNRCEVCSEPPGRTFLPDFTRGRNWEFSFRDLSLPCCSCSQVYPYLTLSGSFNKSLDLVSYFK